MMKHPQKFDVLVVGELNIDLILNKIAGFPEMDKEILAEEMVVTLGSSSAIFANNLSILGSKVTYLGKVGTDNFADKVIDTLKLSGVDTSNIVSTSGFLTGLTVALNYDNDRAMVTYPGAMSDLNIGDISPEVLRSAGHMHLSSIFLQEGLKPDVIELFRRAKEAGLTTSFDPQWDPSENWDIDLKALLPYVDVFLPNESELRQFTGRETIEDGLASIKPFCNVVVVKNGTQGAVMWDKTSITKQKAYLNEKVVDAIGAGDSFNSGFIHKYIHGKSLEECVAFAALTGALNTTGSGGTSAFESLDKLKRTALEKFKYAI
ncbi:MAG: carbohydrate kinase family protein [Bacteroidales bacterium]